MFDPSKFIAPQAKALPVFLLLDVSGSMAEVVDPENVRRTGQTVFSDGQTWELVEGGTSKIDILNNAVKEMINSFAAEERMETEFLISVIIFGDKAVQHISPTSASSIKWVEMIADGSTAMGAAFTILKKAVEDKNVVPSRAYRPTVVLVSDGQPTDNWKEPLELLLSEGRSSKCFFMAMGIGDDPGRQVLERFISQTPILAEVAGRPIPNTVFSARDSDRIHEFFRKVTMSVTTRSKTQNPNAIPTTKELDTEENSYW